MVVHFIGEVDLIAQDLNGDRIHGSEPGEPNSEHANGAKGKRGAPLSPSP